MADHELRNLPGPFLTLDLPDEAATAQLAADISLILKPGDTLCLSGDLGAGKSTLSRALIRSAAGDPDLEVPSPTFTLVQTYQAGRLELSHFDLYRLEDPEELEELGLEDLLETGIALIEWPEKAENLLPEDALWLQITQPEEDSGRRTVLFCSTNADWKKRITFTRDARRFLDEALGKGGLRSHLAGDASLRTFETVTKDGKSLVLMRWPFAEDDLPAKVRTYMTAAGLATDCRSVLAIGGELRRCGIQAPEVKAYDLDAGLILTEHLGTETIAHEGLPVPERYQAAVEVLARLHGQDWPKNVKLADGSDYHVPEYSTSAFLQEVALFPEWYVPEKTGQPVGAEDGEKFRQLWQSALTRISASQTGWVLRDFHSPNLLWLAEGAGADRIGVIDFQDTVFGPVAYDVASLLLDARVDISPALEKSLFDAYLTSREKQSGTFDKDAFADAYAVMAAQRITKILGIFVRLARRDGKTVYLSHLPRMLGYLERVLENPLLSDLKSWYQVYLR